MSTSLASKPLTITQRPAHAAHEVAVQLRFEDEKRLLAALSEIAAEEISRSPNFALRVRSRYEELAPAKPQRASTARSTPSKTQKPQKTLVPIKQLPTHEINVARALDPYFLLEYFGPDQLRDALEQQTAANLREAVAIVKERNPTTKLAGTSGKAMIEYIVRCLLR